MRKYIFLGIIFLFNACSTTNNTNYLDGDTAFKNSENNNLYKLNIDKTDEYDSLTILITNNYIKDFDSIKYFKRITHLTGSTNLATHISYGIANNRYKKTMKLVKNCGDINPSNIPLVLFYMKKDTTCIKFNYASKNDFISILDFTYTQLQKKTINKSDINKFQLKQTIREYAKSMNIKPTLLDSIEILIDKIFDLI